MTEHNQVHSFISSGCDRRIDFLLKTGVLLNFEGVRHSVLASVPDVALFEYERSIPLHMFVSPVFLSLLIHNYV
jgi:hypothetical protein